MIVEDFLPMQNAYSCDKCETITITAHVAIGVTPFVISCPHCYPDYEERARKGEKGMGMPPGSTSSFYGKLLHEAPTHEWYRPEKVSKKDPFHDHWKKGGLSLRERTAASLVSISTHREFDHDSSGSRSIDGRQYEEVEKIDFLQMSPLPERTPGVARVQGEACYIRINAADEKLSFREVSRLSLKEEVVLALNVTHYGSIHHFTRPPHNPTDVP